MLLQCQTTDIFGLDFPPIRYVQCGQTNRPTRLPSVSTRAVKSADFPAVTFGTSNPTSTANLAKTTQIFLNMGDDGRLGCAHAHRLASVT